METHNNQGTNNCHYYIPCYTAGFKLVTVDKGKYITKPEYAHYNMVFMLEGECEFSQSDSAKWYVTKKDLFFHPRQEEVQGIATIDTKMLLFTFSEHVQSLCENFHLSDYMQDINNTNQNLNTLKLTNAMSLFAGLIEKYLDENISCNYLYELKKRELFLLMKREYTLYELTGFFETAIVRDKNFKTLFINNYKEGESVQEISQKLNMSYSTFFKKFKTEFGISIQDWILTQKSKRIIMKLSIPSITIADIIKEFGFSDGAHLNRYCRKYFKCTPLELAKALKSGTKKINQQYTAI